MAASSYSPNGVRYSELVSKVSYSLFVCLLCCKCFQLTLGIIALYY